MKPTLASSRIIAARVNASARKMTSGRCAWTSSISHSQKATGFVCGLSTRKMRTPWSIQKSTTSRSACHSPRQSAQPKSTL